MQPGQVLSGRLDAPCGLHQCRLYWAEAGPATGHGAALMAHRVTVLKMSSPVLARAAVPPGFAPGRRITPAPEWLIMRPMGRQKGKKQARVVAMSAAGIVHCNDPTPGLCKARVGSIHSTGVHQQISLQFSSRGTFCRASMSKCSHSYEPFAIYSDLSHQRCHRHSAGCLPS